MNILLAVDGSHSSRQAAEEGVNLAFNALAEVTILGLCGHEDDGGKASAGCPPAGAMAEQMSAYRRMFLEHGSPEENPSSRDVTPPGG